MKKTEDQSINNREWCNTRRVILLVMEPRSSLWRRRVNHNFGDVGGSRPACHRTLDGILYSATTYLMHRMMPIEYA
jgi:hypothetical protein